MNTCIILIKGWTEKILYYKKYNPSKKKYYKKYNIMILDPKVIQAWKSILYHFRSLKLKNNWNVLLLYKDEGISAGSHFIDIEYNYNLNSTGKDSFCYF